MINLDNVKHVKDKFFDTKGEIVKIEDSKGVLWKKQDTPSIDLIGTWTFNDIINIPEGTINVGVDFRAGNTDYFGMLLTKTSGIIKLNQMRYGGDLAYNDGTWKSSKTIEITSNVLSGDMTNQEFATWLQANATKIA